MGTLSAEMIAAADEFRALEQVRLDALQFALWARAEQGDLVAVDCVLKIMERRARLLGLDATKRAESRTVVRPDVHPPPGAPDKRRVAQIDLAKLTAGERAQLREFVRLSGLPARPGTPPTPCPAAHSRRRHKHP